jgi:hypothetical protein
MSVLESVFIKRNNLAAQNSNSESTFSNPTVSVGKKKKKKKHGKANNVKKLRNNPIDPNSPDYGSQLLKQQLKNKFEGYDYGLSDW